MPTASGATSLGGIVNLDDIRAGNPFNPELLDWLTNYLSKTISTPAS